MYSAAPAAEVSPALAMGLVAVVGLVVATLTVRTRMLARGAGARRRLRKVELRARRDFTIEAASVIERHLAELPPEPTRSRISMDVRDRIDLGDTDPSPQHPEPADDAVPPVTGGPRDRT